MTEETSISIAETSLPARGTVILLADDSLTLGPAARRLKLDALLRRAAATAKFKGRLASTLDLLAPAGSGLDRVLVLGVGKPADLKEGDWPRLGGAAMGALHAGERATVLLDRPDGAEIEAGAAADFCLGAALRGYRFDKYKRRKADEAENGRSAASLKVSVKGAVRVRRAWAARKAVADGVRLARDLVNEPANILGPVEFAERVSALKSLGLKIEVLTEREMKRLRMNALLGVAQGSVRPPRMVVIRWDNGKPREKPIAFVGKGVVFDTGGISIKPAAGMEDMKGDMAGAAAVTGLMAALAGRNARVNAVGLIGIVENMPDGAAQRPGDIVTSMSGQTIEVLNTDAEGRLVLADVIAYAQKRVRPKAIVDLATLTGAIIISLGHHHAGLFSNDDALAEALRVAGEATGEKVWRMPLGPDYDKMLDSKIADMKNIGGRDAGSISAAQFIKRFVDEGVAWAHLDIAGTAMGSPQTEINRSWSSGYGVRLLDRLVANGYEA